MIDFNLVKTLVADQSKVLADLSKHLADATRAKTGLAHAAPTVLTNESEANTRKMLNTTMNVLKRQQELNELVIALLMMLAASRDFTGWQADFAMKTGSKPKDVLHKMFDDLINGRG